MPATYEPIATTTVSTTTNTITFSSIPSTYSDLTLVLVGYSTPSTSGFRFKLNGASTGYSTTALSGDGASATSIRYTSQTQCHLGVLPASVAMLQFNLFSYTGSTNKTALTRLSADTNGAGVADARVHLYQSTSAITEVSLFLSTASQNFATGTTATLYGILKA